MQAIPAVLCQRGRARACRHARLQVRTKEVLQEQQQQGNECSADVLMKPIHDIVELSHEHQHTF